MQPQSAKSRSRDLPLVPSRLDYERVPEESEKPGGSVDEFGEEDLTGVPGEDVDLPEDVYGATIYSVIKDGLDILTGKDHDRLAWWINIVRVIFVVTSLLFNYVLQLSLLVWSWAAVVAPSVQAAQQLYQEYHAECFETDGTYDETAWEDWDPDKKEQLCGMVISNFWFLYLVLSLWWMTMLDEFRKTDRLWRKLNSCVSTRNYERQIEKGDDVLRVKRLTCEVRYFLFVVIVLPKHIVSVGLLTIGTWWLTATESFGDLILNALALSFVIEIDELIFDAMFPAFVAEEMAEVKLWRRRSQDPKDKQRVQWTMYRRSAVYWIVILLGVYVYLAHLQAVPFFGVLPGFAHDTACHSHWKEQRSMVCNSWAAWNGAQCFPYGARAPEDAPPHPEVYDSAVKKES